MRSASAPSTGDTPADARPRAARRSWWALAAFALGLWAAARADLGPSSLWFAGAAIIGAAVLILPASRAAPAGRAPRAPSPTSAALFLAMLALGVGWWTLRHRESPPNALRTVLAAADPLRGMPITITARVLDTPTILQRQRGVLTLVDARPPIRFRVAALRAHADADPIDPDPGRPTSGKLLVLVDDDALQTSDRPLRAGDLVRLTGLARAPGPPLNPGAFDFRRWSADRGEAGIISVPEATLVTILPRDIGTTAGSVRNVFLAARAALRDRAVRVLSAAMARESDEPFSADHPDAARALMLALLLGQADPAAAEVDAAFTRLGLAHVLAISGFHIVVLAAVLLWALRLLGDRGAAEPLALAALVVLYALIVPPGAPVMRAVAMVLAFLAAEALGRRYDRLSLLGWIGLGLLIWRPADLYALGFALSLGLTGVLLGMGALARERLFGIELRGVLPPRGRGLVPIGLDVLKDLTSTSVLCWAFAAPLLLVRTGLFSPVAVVSTILITPIIVPAMGLGFLALLVGMAVPAAAEPAGVALRWLADTALAMVFWLDALPGSSLRIVGVSEAWAIAAGLLILAWFRLGHWRDTRCWAAAAILAVWLAASIDRAGRLAPGVDMRLDTLAVGDGTCHLLRARDEHGRAHAMLIDAGSLRQPVGRRVIPDALTALGVRRVPTVLISHPDLDHYAALPELIRPLGITTVILGDAFLDQAASQPRSGAAALVALLNQREVRIIRADLRTPMPLGDATLTIIGPSPVIPASAPDNERSLVALARASGDPSAGAMLFTGDIQDRAIAALRAEHPNLRPDAMEAPHHGSARPSGIALVADLRPRIVVQSTGLSRAMDPRWDTVRAATTWFTTATDGAAWVEWVRTPASTHDLRAGSILRGPAAPVRRAPE